MADKAKRKEEETAETRIKRHQTEESNLVAEHMAAIEEIRSTMPPDSVARLIAAAHKQFAKAAVALCNRHREETAT